MNKLIAVTIGDINGIGIDIFLNLIVTKKIKKVVLFSNYRLINNYLKNSKLNLKINLVNNSSHNLKYKSNHLNVFTYYSKSNVENTINSIKYSHKETIKKKFIGIVTLPIRKDLIIKKINQNFIGHTEFLQKLENKNNSNMILIHDKLIVSPITTHVRINSVSKILLKKNYLIRQISSLNKTLKVDFNIKDPKIIISGLNPHAGENGEIGDEEIYIDKLIKNLKKKKINITGPVSADSMLINTKNYDCYVFMYHDQALIPFKYISKFSGVNYTGNLNVIRVSPDHGTAYNLKGSKNVSNNSLKKCFSLINKINKNRIKYNDSKKIS
ncbi:MAG: PdxA family protein [Alphaproteobacteria bacterium]